MGSFAQSPLIFFRSTEIIEKKLEKNEEDTDQHSNNDRIVLPGIHQLTADGGQS